MATHTVHPRGFFEINAGLVPGAGAAGQPLNARFGRTASTTIDDIFGGGSYHSLQTKLDRRFSAGFFLTMSYTYSKSVDYFSNSGGLRFYIPSALDRNRAVSDFDRTHNLWISSVWELPLGRDKRWLSSSRLARTLASGWQINAIFSAYSGLPFSVGGPATSLNAPLNTQSADQVLAQVARPALIGSGHPYFDPNAFRAVTDARFGNSGRNAMRGPGQAGVNLGVFRAFRLSEKWRLQFRAEAFNATNTPHFNNPNATVGSADFGTITSAQDDARFFRLALRVSF